MATTTKERTLACPYCGKGITYATEHHGMASDCPHCGKEVVLTGWPVYTPEELRKYNTHGKSASYSTSFKAGLIIAGAVLAGILLVIGGFWSERRERDQATKESDARAAQKQGAETAEPEVPKVARRLKASVNGDVYVVTRGGGAIKMAAIPVIMFEMEALKKTLNKCNQQLAREFPRYKQRYDAERTEDSRLNVWGEWRKRTEQIVKSSLELNVYTDGINRAYNKDAPYRSNTTQTDANGHYSLPIPTAGTYLIIAFGRREFGRVEHYCWVVKYDFTESVRYRADLFNDNERVSQEPEELINSFQDDPNFDAYMLSRVMQGEGLSVPRLE